MTETRQPFDIKIFTVVLILTGMGIAFMYGASARFAERLFVDRSYFFNRQVIYAVFSFLLILIVSRMNPRVFFRLSNLLLVLTIVSLVLVLIPGIGIEINGARRWIPLGLFNFQPSEIAKITLLIFLSKRLIEKENIREMFTKNILPNLLMIGLIFTLVFVEEDFSTSVVILISALSLLFVAGVPFQYFVYLAATGIPIVFFLITSFGHMKIRLSSYLNKIFWGGYVSYQEKQAIKAIENAGFFGNGLGIGSNNARIPESHTDFYFMNIVADIGLIGGLFTLFLFFYLFWRSFKLAYELQNKGYSYLVYSITIFIAWQTILNIGGVLGLLPIAGLPLALLSFGGNSLISTSFGIGIILAISRFHPKREKNDNVSF